MFPERPPMRGLFIPPRKALLSFADTKATQPLDIF
jgi:hypothetical protein